MRYQQDLQVALRDRLRRLVTRDWELAGHEVLLTVDWIAKQPMLRAALGEAELVEPDLDIDAFLEQFTRRYFDWISQTESGRAVLVWKLMQHLANEERSGRGNGAIKGHVVVFSSNFNDGWRQFTEHILAPLFDFLSECVGADSSVLYVLERYVRRVEWFDREDLYARFEGDTRNGEEVYNLDLQRFLFLEGNYTTHAKPRSATGEADLVGELDTEDPLICDGKIFDGAGRGKGYLAKGFNQVVHYAQDYQKRAAYLVIFNITGRPLQLPSDKPDDPMSLPYIEMSGVRVYLVAVRAAPPPATASKLGKARPFTVTRDDLTNPDAGE